MDCRYCGKPFSSAAIYCSECKHYRTAWINFVTFGAANIGLLTATVTGISIIISASLIIYRNYVRHPILIGNLSTVDEVSIANNAQSPILIKEIQFRSTKPPYSEVWMLGDVIEPSKSVTIELMDLAKEKWRGGLGKDIDCDVKERALSFSSARWKAIHNAQPEIDVLRNYTPEFLETDGAEHKVWLSWAKDHAASRGSDRALGQFECEGSITYTSVLSGRDRTMPIACVGVFRFRLENPNPNDHCPDAAPEALHD
jgi:hypothetical protein